MQDAALLDDLVAEQTVLDTLLAELSSHDWVRPTHAAGWSVADTVTHLVVAEVLAHASLTRAIDPVAWPDGPIRTPSDPVALLDAWRTARSATVQAFHEHGDRCRVPWGGRHMAARSLATARLMETWAHGLDCFAALDVAPVDTDRLVHVARLGWRSLPHAFTVAGESPPAPPEQLRVDLVAPSGVPWTFGPDDPVAGVRGAGGDWCRVVTQRWRSSTPPALAADGDLAVAALRVARAFL